MTNSSLVARESFEVTRAINCGAKHKTKKPIAVQWANNLEYRVEGGKRES